MSASRQLHVKMEDSHLATSSVRERGRLEMWVAAMRWMRSRRGSTSLTSTKSKFDSEAVTLSGSVAGGVAVEASSGSDREYSP